MYFQRMEYRDYLSLPSCCSPFLPLAYASSRWPIIRTTFAVWYRLKREARTDWTDNFLSIFIISKISFGRKEANQLYHAPYSVLSLLLAHHTLSNDEVGTKPCNITNQSFDTVRRAIRSLSDRGFSRPPREFPILASGTIPTPAKVCAEKTNRFPAIIILMNCLCIRIKGNK